MSLKFTENAKSGCQKGKKRGGEGVKMTKITIYENYFFCPKIWRSGGESRIFAIGIY